MKRALQGIALTVVLLFTASNAVEAKDYLLYFTSHPGKKAETVEIYMYDPDEETIERVTKNNVNETELTASRDGNFIYYIGEEYDDTDIFSLEYGDWIEDRVTDDSETGATNPVLSPDGKSIFYQYYSYIADDRKDQELEIAAVDLETLEVEMLTDNQEAESELSIGRDGEDLIFIRYDQSGSRTLMAQDLDSGQERVLLEDVTYKAVQSPDGRFFATGVQEAMFGAEFTLFSMESQRLAGYKNEQDYCNEIVFSPDNAYVAFKCFGDGKSRILLMTIDDEYGVEPVTPEDYHVRAFDVTPDGREIYFIASPADQFKDARTREIYKIELESREITRITDNDVEEREIVLSVIPSDEDDEDYGADDESE